MKNEQVTNAGNCPVDGQVRPVAVAWKFMQATYGDGDVRGRGWMPTLKFTKPGWAVMQKDVQPLYDQAALDAAVAAERERCAILVETCDVSGHDGYIETSGDLLEALAGCIRRGA